MSTNYPGSKQTFTNPTSTDKQNSPSHSEQHATVNDTVEALQDQLGITGALTTVAGLKPVADSATAILFKNADESVTYITIDTTNGLVVFKNSSLCLWDTGGDHKLKFAAGSDLNADYTLTFTTGNGNRTVTLSGDLTVESASLVNQDLTSDASPQFAGETLTGLTASRLIASDGSKALVSSAMTSWVAGTADQITVGDDGDGSITLSLPQSIATTSNVQFGSVTVGNTGLHILDTNASHDLIIAPGSDLTADHTLTITTGDADRTITLNESLTVEDAAIVSGDMTSDAVVQFAGLGLYNVVPKGVLHVNLSLTSPIIYGPSALNSYTDCSTTAAAATITKTGATFQSDGLAAGDIILVTDSTTSADEGIYRVVSVGTEESITVERNFTGSNTDVDIILLKDSMIILPPSSGSNCGPILTSGSHTNDPMQIGGYTYATHTRALTAGDIIFNGQVEFDKSTFFDGVAYFHNNAQIYTHLRGGDTDGYIYYNISYVADDGAHLSIGNTDGYGNRHLIITDMANYLKDHDHDTLSTYPIIYFHDSTDPDTSNNKYGFVCHDGNGFVIGTGAVTGAGSVPATIANYIGFHTSTDGLVKSKFYNKPVADEAVITLQTFTNGAWGFCMAGSNEEYAFFTVDDDGDVTLISNSANVVANADTDGNLCIGTAGTQEPLQIKNHLNAEKNIFMIIWYN